MLKHLTKIKAQLWHTDVNITCVPKYMIQFMFYFPQNGLIFCQQCLWLLCTVWSQYWALNSSVSSYKWKCWDICRWCSKPSGYCWQIVCKLMHIWFEGTSPKSSFLGWQFLSKIHLRIIFGILFLKKKIAWIMIFLLLVKYHWLESLNSKDFIYLLKRTLQVKQGRHGFTCVKI